MDQVQLGPEATALAEKFERQAGKIISNTFNHTNDDEILYPRMSVLERSKALLNKYQRLDGHLGERIQRLRAKDLNHPGLVAEAISYGQNSDLYQRKIRARAIRPYSARGTKLNDDYELVVGEVDGIGLGGLLEIEEETNPFGAALAPGLIYSGPNEDPRKPLVNRHPHNSLALPVENGSVRRAAFLDPQTGFVQLHDADTKPSNSSGLIFKMKYEFGKKSRLAAKRKEEQQALLDTSNRTTGGRMNRGAISAGIQVRGRYRDRDSVVMPSFQSKATLLRGALTRGDNLNPNSVSSFFDPKHPLPKNVADSVMHMAGLDTSGLHRLQGSDRSSTGRRKTLAGSNSLFRGSVYPFARGYDDDIATVHTRIHRSKKRRMIDAHGETVLIPGKRTKFEGFRG